MPAIKWLKEHALIFLTSLNILIACLSLLAAILGFSKITLVLFIPTISASFILTIIFGIRNEKVYKRRTAILDSMDMHYKENETVEDYLNRTNELWRQFRSLPNYHIMLNEFWKPVSSYKLEEEKEPMEKEPIGKKCYHYFGNTRQDGIRTCSNCGIEESKGM